MTSTAPFDDADYPREVGRITAYLLYHAFRYDIAERAAVDAVNAARFAGVSAERYPGWVRLTAKRNALRAVADDPHRKLLDRGYRHPPDSRDGTEGFREVDQREALILHADGYRTSEVADQLGIPARTVDDRIAKAKKALQTTLTRVETGGP